MSSNSVVGQVGHAATHLSDLTSWLGPGNPGDPQFANSPVPNIGATNMLGLKDTMQTEIQQRMQMGLGMSGPSDVHQLPTASKVFQLPTTKPGMGHWSYDGSEAPQWQPTRAIGSKL